MIFKMSALLALIILAVGLSVPGVGSVSAGPTVSAQTNSKANSKKPEPALITAEELKAKMLGNQPLTIIDVRSTSSYVDSDSIIKGAIYVKLRRLNSRLAFPPLKNVSHDSEVITYCACPNDEASLRAVEILAAAGFKRVRALKGGWRMWLKVNGPVGARPKSA